MRASGSRTHCTAIDGARVEGRANPEHVAPAPRIVATRPTDGEIAALDEHLRSFATK